MNAPDSAFGNLLFEATQSATASDEIPNSCCLTVSIDMVELEDHRVGFAAIHASVGTQILDHVRSITREISATGFTATFFVERSIIHIVFVQILRLARPAICVALSILAFIIRRYRDIALTTCAAF